MTHKFLDGIGIDDQPWLVRKFTYYISKAAKARSDSCLINSSPLKRHFRVFAGQQMDCMVVLEHCSWTNLPTTSVDQLRSASC